MTALIKRLILRMELMVNKRFKKKIEGGLEVTAVPVR